MLSYAAWTERLCRHFFCEEHAQQPVTFFVDDDLLGFLEGSEDPDRGVESLTSALLTRLAPDSYGRRFNRIDQECSLWKAKGAYGCPPSLPLLAVTVLAATRMARESGIAPNNYWRRFRDLLDFEEHDLKGLNEVLPGLWHQLTWWLDDHHDGDLGLSTIREHSWWTIIGYALSQALFRDSDRQYLTDLFRRIGLAPDEEPNASELLQYFKAWAPVSQLSPGAKHMAGDERYDEQLTAILLDEASRWDGVLRDETGRRIGSLVLTYEPSPRPAYAIAVERPLGFPEQASFEGGGVSLNANASVEGWYAETVPLNPRWLDEGLRLESGDFVLVYRDSPIVPLAQNTVLGCWASVVRVEPGEKHVVLCDSEYAPEVDSFLIDHARDEWKREDGAFAPEGWILFSNVVIEESLEVIPPGPLSVLAPRIRERPTLKGGLPVDQAFSLYLCGGEPDLWLPSLFDDTTGVSVDGLPVEARAGQRISLVAQRLPAGNHEVAVGDVLIRFSTTREFSEGRPVEAGSLGQLLARRDNAYVPLSRGATQVGLDVAGEVAVAGGHLIGASQDLPASRPTILLPLKAKRYRLAGAKPGEVLSPRQPLDPAWMSETGHGALYPIGFEVAPDFQVVWVVIERADRLSVRLRQPTPPEVGGTHTASLLLNEWCSVFELEPELDEQARSLWQQYREAAAEVPRLSDAEAAVARARRTTAVRGKSATAPDGAPKPELVIEKLLKLPLRYSTADRHVYESRDKRFQVTYWPKDSAWRAIERLDEKGTQTERLGRFRTEEEALAAVRAAIHTIRTVRRRR